MRRPDGIRPQRRSLGRTHSRRQRVREPAREPECLLGQLAKLERRDVLARGIHRHEADRVKPRALGRDFVPGDAEGRRPRAGFEMPVQEQSGARRKPLGKPGLVEPERTHPRTRGVDDGGLDDLQVSATCGPDRDALDRAGDRGLLPGQELPEPLCLTPIEIVPRDVLHEVANRPEAHARQLLSHLRPDPSERLDGGLRVHPSPRLWHVLVHASKAGQHRARACLEGQDEPSIGPSSDGAERLAWPVHGRRSKRTRSQRTPGARGAPPQGFPTPLDRPDCLPDR